MSRRRMMMANIMRGQEPEKELGLVFTGTQYIDSIFVPTNATRVVIDFKWSDMMVANAHLFGGRISSTSGAFAALLSAEQPNFGQVRHEFGATRNYSSKGFFGERLTVDANRNTMYINGETAVVLSATSFSAQYQMYIGTVNTAGSSAQVKLYGIIYSALVYQNDIHVRDFVPVRQGSTKYSPTPAPSNCMWDKVSGAYFQNAGTGAFGIEEV